MIRLGLIVEGQTEERALPVLIRRWAAEAGRSVEVARPFRVRRTQIAREGELDRSIARLRSRAAPDAVLLVIDGDHDPWDDLEATLHARGQAAGIPFRAVVAVRTFEAWLLAAKPSLRGVRGIRPEANVPAEGSESVANGAARLSANMVGGRRYVKVDDAPAFVDRVDLGMAAAHSPSFQRFLAAMEALVPPEDATP